MKPRPTKTVADTRDPTGSRHIVVWDRALASFGVRVSAAERKTFVLQQRIRASRQQKITLGV
ncbi:MAG TPA: hypothetical protein VFQ90_11650 [Stellaceae bacterium]|jgi:hypothetical protein|nr:hypothetical protein [Stellaceae bacterium]